MILVFMELIDIDTESCNYKNAQNNIQVLHPMQGRQVPKCLTITRMLLVQWSSQNSHSDHCGKIVQENENCAIIIMYIKQYS